MSLQNKFPFALLQHANTETIRVDQSKQN